MPLRPGKMQIIALLAGRVQVGSGEATRGPGAGPVLPRSGEPRAGRVAGGNTGHVPARRSVKKFLQSWAINTLAVLVAVYIVPGIRFKDDSLWTPFVTSLVLGILNAFIRPILMLWRCRC